MKKPARKKPVSVIKLQLDRRFKKLHVLLSEIKKLLGELKNGV